MMPFFLCDLAASYTLSIMSNIDIFSLIYDLYSWVMIERSHLVILTEIDKQGSLTAAADTLCVTQSALSHSIRKLEQQLDTSIWVKDGRKLRLTQAGQFLLSLANRLLPQFEHAESVVRQIAGGQQGVLRIGIECHPCNEWLLPIVAPYLKHWPDVDVDIKRQFKFGGIGALFNHEIDILVTPDPLKKNALRFVPVFDYEQVLVVGKEHRLAGRSHISPRELSDETLITYPVETQRLDIFSHFLIPAGISPIRHKTVETTDILFQLVAAGRGVSASPRWLVDRYAKTYPVIPIRMGRTGIKKQIFVGTRSEDTEIAYIKAFIDTALSIARS
jgi:LysR family transcriptional regulator for metE and metH